MWLRIMLFVILLSLSACMDGFFDDDDTQPLTVGEEITLTGTVVGSVDDCVVDGICALVIETETGIYNAIWATGMMPCEGDVSQASSLGETIEIFGEVTNSGSVSACSSAEYYIRVVD